MSIQRGHFQISTLQAPVGRGKKDSPTWFCPPDESTQENRRASPVAGGPGGEPPMSARSAQALIEGGPRGLFGSFLDKQKGTPVPSPAPQGGIFSKNTPQKGFGY